jgi:hypothetical protein
MDVCSDQADGYAKKMLLFRSCFGTKIGTDMFAVATDTTAAWTGSGG